DQWPPKRGRTAVKCCSPACGSGKEIDGHALVIGTPIPSATWSITSKEGRHQISAKYESLIINARDAFANCYIDQACAVFERIETNPGDAIANHHIGKAGAESECIIPYGRNT